MLLFFKWFSISIYFRRLRYCLRIKQVNINVNVIDKIIPWINAVYVGVRLYWLPVRCQRPVMMMLITHYFIVMRIVMVPSWLFVVVVAHGLLVVMEAHGLVGWVHHVHFWMLCFKNITIKASAKALPKRRHHFWLRTRHWRRRHAVFGLEFWRE